MSNDTERLVALLERRGLPTNLARQVAEEVEDPSAIVDSPAPISGIFAAQLPGLTGRLTGSVTPAEVCEDVRARMKDHLDRREREMLAPGFNPDAGNEEIATIYGIIATAYRKRFEKEGDVWAAAAEYWEQRSRELQIGGELRDQPADKGGPAVPAVTVRHRQASWFNKATGGAIYANLLRQAHTDDRLPAEQLPASNRWYYLIDNVAELWPDYGHQIRAAEADDMKRQDKRQQTTGNDKPSL